MKPPLALGFTLIELLVTIAMIAIVTAIGVPAFKDTVRNNVLTAGMNDFIATLNFARSEAVKRGVTVTARKTSASTSVGWESGWEVFTDADADGEKNAATDQVLRVHEPLKNNYTLRGNNNFKNYISYKPSGESNTIGSFALCDTSVSGNPTKRTARLIAVSILGRISLTADIDNDGILKKNDGTDFTSCTNP
ncbi:MAG: GspH/FimT family pseudopilin [Proteobacteria bacterium]|nr:GspH/FimT family pseudopilin [Pseudomonadota bacterium]